MGSAGWERFGDRGTRWLASALIALVFGLGSAGIAAADGWSGVTNLDPTLTLDAVSCSSNTFCLTVGGYNNGSTTAQSTFDGTSWAAPVIIGAGVPVQGLSCVSSSFCMGVGVYGSATYDGSSWSTSLATGGTYVSVSCVSSTFCVGAGEGHAGIYRGGGWSSPSAISPGIRETVSCVSTSFCMAVDDSGRAVSYDGTSWSAAALIDGNSGGLVSLSCASASLCAAVDGQGDALTFNGVSWTAPTSIDPGNQLAAISCTGTYCLAVDAAGNGVEYSGGAWGAPMAIDPLGGGLRGVSCTAASNCALVDLYGVAMDYTGSSLDASTLAGGGLMSTSCPSASFCAAVDWNGRAFTFDGAHWSAPTTVEASGNGLISVSCPSVTSCTAIDLAGDAFTFSGSSWSPGAAFDPGGGPDSISCPTSAFCVAVDQAGQAYTYSGGGWDAGKNIDGGQPLYAVSCPTSSFCAAADAAGNVLFLHNGSWTAPVLVDGQDGLSSISCASASLCEAVGGDSMWTYNGSVWSQSGFDSNAYYHNEGLASVSCPTANFCAASDTVSEVSTFDGNAWGSPTELWGYFDQHVVALSCSSAAFCAAVDDAGNAFTYAATVPPPPTNISPPSISGVAEEGQTLTAAGDAWTNNPSSVAYQWQDCDISGSNCVAIAGANDQFYSPAGADIGDTIRVQEWAYNSGGTAGPVTSTPTAVVQPASRPANLSAPTVSGIDLVGQLLTASPGSWSEDPTSFSYEWFDCSSTHSCRIINGATGATYRLSASDSGSMIEVQVRALNVRGPGFAWSALTAVVSSPPIPLQLTYAPKIFGRANVGKTISANSGTWNQWLSAVAYQWQRCSKACVPIAGQTTRYYTLTRRDIGASFRLVISATATSGGQTFNVQAVTPLLGPVGPSVATLKAALLRLLVPIGVSARASALLRAGRDVLRFTAPSPGRLTLVWYARNGAVIARAAVTFRNTRPTRVWLDLTRAGRRLLSRGGAGPVQALADFYPYGQRSGLVWERRWFGLSR